MVVLVVALLAASLPTCSNSSLTEIRSALQQHDSAKAASLLQSNASACSEAPEFFELQGIAAEMAGDSKAAESALDRATQLAPREARFLEELGATYLKDRKNTQAAVVLEKAATLDPASDTVKKYLAGAYVQGGEWNRAASLLDDLARRKALTPKDPILILWFAQALIKTNQLGRLNEVTQGLAADPPPLLFELGNLFAQNAQYEKAAACFRQIPEAEADEAVYFNLGLSYSHLQLFSKARDSYFRSIDKHPDYVEAYFRIGVDYGTEGKARLAVPWLLRARDLAPDRADISYALAEQLILLGYNDTAESVLAKAREIDSANEWLMIAEGDLKLARNQPAAARSSFEKVLTKNPQQEAAMVGFARILIVNGEETGAATYLKRALALRPEDPVANRELGKIEERQQQWEAALEHLMRARKEGGASEVLAVELSRVERQLGHPEEALKALEEVVPEERQVSAFHMELAQVYLQLHKTAAAESERSAMAQAQAGTQGQLHFDPPKIYVH